MDEFKLSSHSNYENCVNFKTFLDNSFYYLFNNIIKYIYKNYINNIILFIILLLL